MASSKSPPSWEIKEDNLKIEKDQKLGDGVYSKVFRAKWYKDDGEVVDVAAKVLPNACANEQEIDILSEISKKPHPNIIKFYGAVRGNNITIVTELARKGSVYDYLKEQKRLKRRLTPARLRAWALQAASAIEHLHENNVMHRDVKSPNFLIMDDFTLKLCDFGITNTDITHTKTTGQKKGSLRWMAPELHDEKVSMKSDIFSYGTLIWEMVTCEEPYHQYQKEYILIDAIMNKKEELPIPEDCPEDLKSLITRCRQHDKDARPSISNILNELSKVQAGIMEKEPIQESQDQANQEPQDQEPQKQADQEPQTQANTSGDADEVDAAVNDDSVAQTVEDMQKISLRDSDIREHSNLQDWKNLLRQPNVKERLCNSIVPSTILSNQADIITVHEDQQVRAMETNKGHISAATLLIDFLLESSDQNWPSKLLEGLTPADAILVSFLEIEMQSFLDRKELQPQASARTSGEDGSSIGLDQVPAKEDAAGVEKRETQGYLPTTHRASDQTTREFEEILEEIADDLDFEFVATHCKPNDMEALYRHLLINKAQIEQIKEDHKTLGTRETGVAVMQAWRTKGGRKATRKALLDACKSSRNKEAADKLEDELNRKYISKK